MKENIQPESTGINLVKGIELVLHSGADPRTGYKVGVDTGALPETFEDFYRAYLAEIYALIDTAMTVAEYYDRHFDRMSPTPLLSGNFESALRTGKDFYYNGSKYHNTVITASCLGSAVDSLYAIEKYVYRDRRLTLFELRDALAANWVGYEQLREEIANDSEKYGNNLECVDRHARDLAQRVADYIHSKRTWLGGSYSADGEGIDHGIRFGKLTGATPDGRYAGDQLSKNLQSVFGCDRRGLLAYLHSVTKIDATNYPNGAPIDFVMHPSAAEGEDGLDAMVSIVRMTFKKGGSAIHGNVYSADLLRDAQAHPENYKGLQVRLCGWSQYFNKLSRDEQDMLIRQAETA